jgi:hypothetical protein
MAVSLPWGIAGERATATVAQSGRSGKVKICGVECVESIRVHPRPAGGKEHSGYSCLKSGYRHLKKRTCLRQEVQSRQIRL